MRSSTATFDDSNPARLRWVALGAATVLVIGLGVWIALGGSARLTSATPAPATSVGGSLSRDQAPASSELQPEQPVRARTEDRSRPPESLLEPLEEPEVVLDLPPERPARRPRAPRPEVASELKPNPYSRP